MNFYFNHKINTGIKGTTRFGEYRRSILLYIAVFLCGLLVNIGIDSNLYAQRSKPYVNVNSSLIKNNLRGYPGLFDTNTVGHGSLVLEAPSLLLMFGSKGSLLQTSTEDVEESEENESTTSEKQSSFAMTPLLNFNLDYGINPSFSLGTNPLLLFALLKGGVGGSLKARTKVYEGSNFADVVTFSAGGLNLDMTENVSVSLNYFLFSNNASFVLTSNSSFTLSTHFWSFSANAIAKEIEGMDDDVNAGSIELMTSFIAGNYQYSFNRNFGVSAVLVWPFYVDCVIDSTELRESIDSFGLNYERMIFRLGGHLNLGSSNILEGGPAYSGDLGGVLVWIGYSHNFS